MDVICIGELLIDFLPVQSGVRFEEVEEFRRVPGGAPANVAVGASKLGLASAFLGRVGDDLFGKYLASVLDENRVDISQVQYDRKARTTLAFISLPTPNTREFQFYRNPGADMNLDYREFDEEFIKGCRICHFGSITLINEPGRESTLKAVKAARDAGAVISYDPNYRPMLWPSEEEAKKLITEAIPLAHSVKVSDEELKLITGSGDIDKGAALILEMGPSICIVTMGEQGCHYSTKGFSGYLPAYSVETVDATGCGDSFVSGTLYGILKNGIEALKEQEGIMVEVLKYASAAAALTATRKGVIPSLPQKDEVDRFISILDRRK